MTPEEAIAAHRARLDETAVRFDRWRRMYSEIVENEHQPILLMRPKATWEAVELALAVAFGKRPDLPLRTAAEVKAERKPIRIIGGRRPRRRR